MSLVREQVSRGPCRWRDRPLERLSEREHRHRVSNRRLAELERAREGRVRARAARWRRSGPDAQRKDRRSASAAAFKRAKSGRADGARWQSRASGVKRVDDRTAMLHLTLGSQRVEGERGEGADDERAADQRGHRRDAGAQQEVEQRDENERTQIACAISSLQESLSRTDGLRG